MLDQGGSVTEIISIVKSLTGEKVRALTAERYVTPSEA